MRNPSFFLQRCSGRIKALYWDETGYVQLYKCLMEKWFQWSRNESELKEFTQHEFRGLMESLSIIQTLEINTYLRVCEQQILDQQVEGIHVWFFCLFYC